MSDQITVAHSQAWHDSYYSLSQQRESRFERFVRTDSEQVGKWAWFNRLGAIEMQERTSRHQDTNLINTPHSRRGCTIRDYEVAELIDRQDLHRLLTDPAPNYVQNFIWAANRKKDNVILRAVRGNAVSADEDDAQTNNALPSAQKIAASSTGLTLTKLRSARKLLRAQEAILPMDEADLPCAVAAEQMDDLLGIPEFKSIDYSDQKAITIGRVARGMGFMFIETEDLETDSSGNRLVLAWKPSAIGFRGPEGEPVTSLDRRADKGNSMQALAQQTMGAVRIEDACVVEIACAE